MESVKEYYDSIEINGRKITIYRCHSTPPASVYGNEMDFETQFDSSRKRKEASNEIYFEAYVSGENKTFYRSKTEPTEEELMFQLKSRSQNVSMETIIGWVVMGIILLFFISLI